nr:MAG TPA: hypothetical protein [Caudoviricetes sp.]
MFLLLLKPYDKPKIHLYILFQLYFFLSKPKDFLALFLTYLGLHSFLFQEKLYSHLLPQTIEHTKF